MKKKIRILIIDDSEDDALLEVNQIKKSGYEVYFQCIDTANEMVEALQEEKWDIILADYSMPKFNGIEALELLKKSKLDIPFIIISGTIGEELAVEAMRAGAHDYIMKNNLKRLLPAVEREIQEAALRAERTLLEQKKKLAEERLKVFSHAVEQSPVMIILTDTNGIIGYVNPKLEDITGYTSADLIGSQYSSFHDEKTYGENNLSIVEYLELKKLWKEEIQKQKKDGTLFWTSVAISPIKDNDGNTIHYVIIEEDITNKKRIEKELIVAKEHAEESDELKTAFLQNMSHEIRTPMNAILGFSDLLIDQNKGCGEPNNYAQIIQNSCNDLLNIIDSILDIAKIESGQLSVFYGPCELKELFDDLLLLFDNNKIRLEKENIQFIFKSYSKTLTIESDPLKLKQILINLLNNALKFTDEGNVEVGYKFDKNQHIVFHVSDSGIGIPPEMHKKIFQRFFKLEQNGTKFLEGTGLGLAIVKEFLDLLGGKIWLESEPNVGSTFYFSLPCKVLKG